MYMATAQAATIVIPELKASPSNSHVFRVSGADFNASTAVTLQLVNGTDALYKFTEAVATNDAGVFDAIVVAPTSINGTYDLMATTYTVKDAYNVTATIKVTLPNMAGPQGLQGVNGTGTQGPQGETGPAGVPGEIGEIANTDALVAVAGLSIFLSFVACVVALFYKKK